MINASEDTVRATAAAIGRAALFDDKITAGDAPRIAAWAEALEPHKLAGPDLLAAVTDYYGDNKDGRTVQVSDIIRRAREIRRQRAESEKAADPYERRSLPAGDGWAGLPISAAGEPVWNAYDVNGAIDRECPACHALPDNACITARDQPQKIPCLARLKP